MHLLYNVRIQQLPGNDDLSIPERMSESAAGFDLQAAVMDETVLEPGERVLIPTGIALEMPEELEAQVRPRSGLALKHGITLLNSPGTIDSDYRGEVKVILHNHGQEPFSIRRGERIAQLVFQELPKVRITQARELSATERGSGGFGHTGK
ncbi:dUTP diphosphatase [Salinithrix halophila]|uniref:Deoxyuridine 5'-triphosphate nucleotidohydrolase n=1 Tax=Salinithrix halophila TaxID=1485204 RepID=A0ABV8JH88_9BACL